MITPYRCDQATAYTARVFYHLPQPPSVPGYDARAKAGRDVFEHKEDDSDGQFALRRAAHGNR